ncbi:MAG TPA: NADH-ubiquinone oxidoreductase-F iron-sulfur binding region domain-containing protein [Thermodesulfovibrionales bacterium]|nr:NADH-ubiquinone oxidoreductase-F iron-sulfur binding region domain-containing protein [Thermodesulfovibrionales bacterium]
MTETNLIEKKEAKVEDIRKQAEEKGCPVQMALYYVTEFLAGPMCGKCFPCSMGSYEAKLRLQNIVNGSGTEADLRILRRIATDMNESSMCKKGKDTAKFILDWMNSDVFERHIAGSCPTMQCTSYVEYRVVPERCTRCGVCLEACTYHAIFGQKGKPFLSGYPSFEIRPKKCVKCDACRVACPEGAIIVSDAETGFGSSV